MCITLAAIAPFAEQEFLPRLGKVCDRLFLDLVPVLQSRTPDDRPNRHQDPRRFGTPALLVLSLTVAPTLAADERFEKKRHQAGGIGTRHQHDIAALAAVAAVRPASRDEFLPAKTAAPVPSIACLCMDANLIDKFHQGKLPPPFTRVEREFLRIGSPGSLMVVFPR